MFFLFHEIFDWILKIDIYNIDNIVFIPEMPRNPIKIK